MVLLFEHVLTFKSKVIINYSVLCSCGLHVHHACGLRETPGELRTRLLIHLDLQNRS